MKRLLMSVLITLSIFYFYICLSLAHGFTSTASVTTTISSGKDPEHVAILSDRHIALVANEKSGNIDVIDLTGGQVLTTIAAGRKPSSIAIDKATSTAYVIDEKTDRIMVIDLATWTLKETLDGGRAPEDIAIDTQQNRLVVVNHKDDIISLIDLSTGAFLGTYNTGRSPETIAIDPLRNVALVTNRKDDTISVIDMGNGLTMATIPTGRHPSGIAVDPVNSIALVANKKDDTLSVIDMNSYKIMATISVGRDPEDVAVNPISSMAIVTNHRDDTATLIDLASLTVKDTISTGRGPEGTGIDISANIAIVANEKDDTLTLIHLPDTVPPVIEITYPEDGSFLNKTSITVTGNVHDIYGDVAGITVNGQQALVSGNTFTAPLDLGEGENIITIKGWDGAGNYTDMTIKTTRDTIPPLITINGVKDGLITNKDLTPLVEISDLHLEKETVTLNNQPYLSGTTLIQEGSYTLLAIASDMAGNVSSKSISFTIDKTPPQITASLINLSEPMNMNVTITGDKGSVEPGSQLNINNTTTGTSTTITVDGDGAFTTNISASYGDIISLVAVDGAGNMSNEVSLQVAPMPSASSSIPEGTFGYAYKRLIPPDITLSAYDPERFSIITGLVKDTSGNPLQGVAVKVHDHPEYGTAYTDPQGRYSMPVDGGNLYVMDFVNPGFLMSQRVINTGWNRIHTVDTVVMVQQDMASTSIAFSGDPSIHIIHKSTPITDGDGTRSIALVFDGDTQVGVTAPDGTSSTITGPVIVRATEFTSPDTMPMPLPATSAFTYAVDLTIDGVDSLSTVHFSKPVMAYVDNFLNFPVGERVPAGYYDRNRATWIPASDGLVVRLLDTDNDGLVDSLDANGDNLPDDLNNNGDTRDEVAGISGDRSFTPGSTYWRVAINHFTPWDFNWPYDLPQDATVPPGTPPVIARAYLEDVADTVARLGTGEEKECTGSFVSVESGILEDDFPIPDTPLVLHYQSSRTEGYKYKLTIPVTGATIPQSLLAISVDVAIAGQTFHYDLPPGANQDVDVIWDGKDYLGNYVQGETEASVKITFEYPLVYRSSGSRQLRAFAEYGDLQVIGPRNAFHARVFKNYKIPIRASTGLDIASIAPGWSIGLQHRVRGDILYRGDGGNTPFYRGIISTVAGNGQWGSGGDGGPAIDAQLMDPIDIATGPDGTVYILTTGNSIRKVTPDGIIHTLNISLPGMTHTMAAIDTGSDGSLYVADRGANQVYRILPDGTVRVIAGNGGDFSTCSNNLCTDGPAIERVLGPPVDIVAGPDGNIYVVVVDSWIFHGIRKIGPDGILTTFSNFTTPGPAGSDYIRTGQFNHPNSIAVGPDGNIFIADGENHIIRRISPDGTISTVAGTGSPGMSGDGGPALSAQLWWPYSIDIGPDGSIFFSDGVTQRIRRISPDGIIETVAGSTSTGAFSGDGGPSIQAGLNNPHGIAIDPSGNLYIADRMNLRVRKVDFHYARSIDLTSMEIFMGDPVRGEGYVFDRTGKHIRTVDLDTGITLFTFEYDQDGKLISITDRFGKSTILHRTGGVITAIEGPHGILTGIGITGNHLTAITYPDSSTYGFTYNPEGLMIEKRDPLGGIYSYAYDRAGRVKESMDPSGGIFNFSRTLTRDAMVTTVIDPDGRSETTVRTVDSTGHIHVERMDNNGIRSIGDKDPGGLMGTLTLKNGTTITQEYGVDPIYFTEERSTHTLSLPSGLTYLKEWTRQYKDMDGDGAIDLITRDNIINGRPATLSHDLSTHLITMTTPSGRKETIRYDATTLMPMEEKIPGLATTVYSYDQEGHLTGIDKTDGVTTRSISIAYDPQGHISRITGPSGGSVDLLYDPAGRIISLTMPDGGTITYGYDGNGNLTSITPPGRPSHIFTYTPVNLLQAYTPPHASGGNTIYTYNLSRELTGITRPDGTNISITYKERGKVDTVNTPMGQIHYAYDPATGDLSSITTPDGEVLTFNLDGSMLTGQEWGGIVSGSVKETLNKDLLPASESVNNAYVIDFIYDQDNLLTRAGDLIIGRDPVTGLITDTSLGNITDTWTYNGFGEVTGYNVVSSGTEIFRRNYIRDSKGRIIHIDETVGGITTSLDYSYDMAGRLIEVRMNGTSLSQYTYDANGNRLSHTGPDGTITAIYDSQDRLLSYGKYTYTYTGSGDLLEKVNNTTGAITTYEYDPLNNLRAVVLPDGTRIEYVIDGLNRRIGKKVNGTLVQAFLYKDGLNPVAELDGNGNVTARFVYATRPDVPDYMIRNGTVYRIISDHLGSPRLVIDTSTGAIAERIDYDEFGRIRGDTNPGLQPFRFAGGLYDRDTGLIRFGTRDYDPYTGRWTTKDPILFAGGDTNLYGYVLNDPVNLSDPHGLWYLDIGFSGTATGNLGPGYTLGLQISSSGVYWYHGFGLGIGKGFSVTLDPFDEPGEGVWHTTVVRAGTGGIGIQAGGSIDRNEFSWVWGIGWGVGFGETVTVTHTIKILDWSSIHQWFDRYVPARKICPGRAYGIS